MCCLICLKKSSTCQRNLYAWATSSAVRSKRFVTNCNFFPCSSSIVTKRKRDVREVLDPKATRSEEHTSELQSRFDLVCRLLLEKKKKDHTECGYHMTKEAK